MKSLLSVSAFASFAVLATASYGNAQNATDYDGQIGKFICFAENAKTPTPRVMNFEERHRRFVLTIKRIVRPQLMPEMCFSNLAYWMPFLSEKGTFDPSIKPYVNTGDIKTFSDFRANIVRNCLSSYEATIKFFDRDYAIPLVSYEWSPTEFVGITEGVWLRFHAGRFQAGESWDFGPVVFTGHCARL